MYPVTSKPDLKLFATGFDHVDNCFDTLPMYPVTSKPDLKLFATGFVHTCLVIIFNI